MWFDLYEQPTLIEDLLPPNHGWEELVPWDINDLNQIVGQADRGPHLRGFTLTPVHPSFYFFHPIPGQAGEVNRFRIDNAPPNTDIIIVAGTEGGGTYIPGCTTLENVLQIQNPRFVARVRSDHRGRVEFSRMIPESFTDKTYLIQALIPGRCAISTMIEQTF